MTTTKLIPTEFIITIDDNKTLIEKVINESKKGKSKASQKHLAYKEEKLIHLIGYLYERSNNLYNTKKTYNGIPVTALTSIIGFSSTKQTQLHLDILIALKLITRTGKPKAGYSSYDYTVKAVDLFNFTGYKNKELFTKYVFTKHKIKNYAGNILLNKAIQELVRLDTNSQEYIKIKNNVLALDKQNETYIEYIEQHFKNNCFGFQISDTNGRRMSLFSACKKEFRSLLTIDGESITPLDFSNSQPAFLANLIKRTYEEFNIEFTEDIKLFIKLCSNGTIYDYIGKMLFECDRNKAKDLWMCAGYGHMSVRVIGDEVVQSNKNGLLFATLFPNVIKFLDNKKDEDSYNKVSISLQKAESDFVNKVSDILFENGIINITVYDEFIVKTSDRELAEKIIKNELNKSNLNIILKADKNSSNDIKNETNETILETKEVSLEVTYIASKDDYMNQLNKWHTYIESVRFFRENKIKILNELVSKQLRKKSDIINIVKKYN